MNPTEWLDHLAGTDLLDVLDPEYPPTALIPGPDAWTYSTDGPTCTIEALPARNYGWWAHG